jgi:DNA processing protein
MNSSEGIVLDSAGTPNEQKSAATRQSGAMRPEGGATSQTDVAYSHENTAHSYMSIADSPATTAPSSQPTISPPDTETLARATLTFCLDGADALMFALLKGAESAQSVVTLFRDATVDGMCANSSAVPNRDSSYSDTSHSDTLHSGLPYSAPERLGIVQFGTAGSQGSGAPNLAASNPDTLKASTSKTSAHARRELESLFAMGIARWGRSVDHRGMRIFRRTLNRWLARFLQLPGYDPQLLSDWFTMEGSQWIIAPHSKYWPSQLADLSTRKDWAAPLCLWGYGTPSSLVACPKPIAIVGSRGVSEYGRSVAHDIALQAAADGHIVVSGGAFGTDAAAHWGALEASRRDDIGAGTTVAVFAGGLNHIGPQRNERLFEAILANGGALVSELCPGTVPEARRFLLRNRIIAALSSTVVVAQARARSGALNTANWAAELGREVYAVPGGIDSPDNAGCNALIRDGKAVILCSTHHIDELCHKRHERFAPETESSEPTEFGTSTDSDEQADRTGQLHPGNSNDEPATDASPKEVEASRRYESVRTAIRRCRRRGLAAEPNAIFSMLVGDNASGHNATSSSTSADEEAGRRSSSCGIATFAQLTEALGEMELMGMVEFHKGAIRISRQSDKESGNSCDASSSNDASQRCPADKENQS